MPARPLQSQYVRIERTEDVPPRLPHVVDVAVLDMNHGWPNLGHDCLVHAVLEEDEATARFGREAGVYLRVLSFDVRRCAIVPELPGGRFVLYLGTGGPGHLDPHDNDGVSAGSQGMRENASWEGPLFRLFDSIFAAEDAALLAICHSFGVLCRWAGVARPVLRGPEKGGKSTGVLENLLTPEAAADPWFGRFVNGGERRLRILDNRLFDLIPGPQAFPSGMIPIAYETLGVGGPRGDALTMMEFARDRGGVMPRVFGVNHHPEILHRAGQLEILDAKLAAGEVDEQWVAERREILTRSFPDEDSETRLAETAEITLLGPLRFHLRRQLAARAEELGRGGGQGAGAAGANACQPHV
jgi:hypothetical protein